MSVEIVRRAPAGVDPGPDPIFFARQLSDLDFNDRLLDLVADTEVLEHVPDPGRVLAEMARVARRSLIVSVPREPLWRALNVARGAYLKDFPDLTADDIQACFAFAADRDRRLNIVPHEVAL